MRHGWHLNGICPYYTMFPLEFPLKHLDGIERGNWVLDPFCGRGTTALACRVLGLNTVGTDVNPVAIAITKAKLAEVTPTDIAELANEILIGDSNDERPTGRFWELAFAENTLTQVLKLRNALAEMDNPAANALRGIVLGSLHGPRPKTKDSYLSNQMQRTFAPKPDYAVRYWERHQLLPKEVDVIALIKEKADRYYSQEITPVRGAIVLTDAKSAPKVAKKYAATITSPPYFGMDTYVPDQWLRNWFVGGEPRPVYAKGKQLSSGDTEKFESSLAGVWKSVATKSCGNAKLVVRFGAIASRSSCPREVMLNSIAASNAPWKEVTISPAGAASGQNRQAEQMGKIAKKNNAVEEFDFVFQLTA